MSLRDLLEKYAKGVLSASIAAAFAYFATQWNAFEFPYKEAVAFFAVALWNRFRGR